jgi:mono/diheme cytochrome c family protein
MKDKLNYKFNMKQKLIFLLNFGVFFILGCGGTTENQQNETSDVPPGVGGKVDQAPAEEAAAGKQIYSQVCMVCHQQDGQGVPGMYPPLINTEYVTGAKEDLINIVLKGMTGPIEVNGETYNAIMPAQNYLSDQEIASVLTYVREQFGSGASAVSPEEVAAQRSNTTQ